MKDGEKFQSPQWGDNSKVLPDGDPEVENLKSFSPRNGEIILK